MEDTLRVIFAQREVMIPECLNPCSNGRYSQSKVKNVNVVPQEVLILVLMEDTLRVFHYLALLLNSEVLILVLMEDTLRAVLV